jgi:hypothetical protein
MVKCYIVGSSGVAERHITIKKSKPEIPLVQCLKKGGQQRKCTSCMKTKNSIYYAPTPYGFKYGAANVDRLMHDMGRVVIGVKTPKGRCDILVTKTGKITIFGKMCKFIEEAK